MLEIDIHNIYQKKTMNCILENSIKIYMQQYNNGVVNLVRSCLFVGNLKHMISNSKKQILSVKCK